MDKETSHSKKMQDALNRKEKWVVKYGMFLACVFIIVVIALLEAYLRSKNMSLLNWVSARVHR